MGGTYPRGDGAPAKIGRVSEPAAEPEMRNPFRSEADAFRVLVIIVIAAAVVIAAALLVGSWLGAVLGLVAIALGLRSTVGWLRVGLSEREEDPAETEKTATPPR